MIAVLLRDYRTQYTHPVRFARGETVTLGARDTEWPQFVWATDAGGRSGWVHERWLDTADAASATAVRDYTARELNAVAGERVRLIEEAGGWYWVENESGAQGWLPARDLSMDTGLETRTRRHMSTIKTFFLPDLGEGLPDATIVEWAVRQGETVRLDAPLVSMETAKAVVEVPSPYSGKVVRLHGANGDVIVTGAALIEIELDASLPQRADAQDTGHHHGPPPKTEAAAARSADESTLHSSATAALTSGGGGGIAAGQPAPRQDAGTVVGAMEASDRVVSEQAVSVGGVKAMPAVRALAKKLGVDLARVAPSGTGGVVTMNDVKDAASKGTARAGSVPAAAAPLAAAAPPVAATAAAPAPQRTAISASGQPMRTAPPSAPAALGQPEQLKGVRRNMARVMADAHAKVVPTTLCDDADLHAWLPGNDITGRLIRALVRACKAVPALNAWFDGDTLTRTLHPHVDVGIAVDTEDGLFVPALRNADVLDAAGLRQAINRLRDSVRNRSIPAEELKGYTISLSNFGVFAGRYATPVVVPPCVSIVAAGKLRFELVPVMGGVETHRLMPLSLTFDHRAATGGEAARFLKAMLDDLALAS